MTAVATYEKDRIALAEVFRDWWLSECRNFMTSTEALESLRTHLEPNGYFIGCLNKIDPKPFDFSRLGEEQ